MSRRRDEDDKKLVSPTAIDRNGRIPAAAYVRMSTDHQRYSIENQIDAIAQYARHHDLEIIRTYSDAGKSGLKLGGRDGLERLLTDVKAGTDAFKAILVYDISRWGRFQDADEAAYYEYICRRAGYTVQYCAEQFDNDGSPIATIVKGVKRAMAGEYSRELSGKVFAGQCRLVELGFRQGGAAGFGLRRMLIDEKGIPKGLLERGEHKSLQTDRVILVPGAAEDVEIVRQMYRSFIEHGKNESEIAEQLNADGIKTDLGRQWTRGTVHQILTNEKYIGNNVFNRTSFKLKKRRVDNTPDMWVRSEGAFEAIIESAIFHTAQGIIRERSRRFSDTEMLARLNRVYQRYGYISGLIIDEAEDVPSSSAYAYRFGSLLSAYSLIGFKPDRDYRYIEINRRLRQYHSDVVAKVIERIISLGATVQTDPPTELIHINHEFTASITIARHLLTGAGASRWKIRFDAGLRPDVTIGIRMDPANESALDYYLLPRIDFCQPSLRLADENGLALDAYRFASLDYLFEMAERCSLRQVA